MTEVFRRVYRIFAHAWFSHKDVFWRVESKTGLYLLFKTVCDEYRLIPEDNYTIPPEAEGIETTPVATRAMPTILQRDLSDPDPAGNTILATGNTTKRHRHTMSHDRSVSVSTVIHEEVEEDEDGEQPTGHGPLLLTRVETARHEEPTTLQEQHQDPDEEQEQEIPAEDPPPYAEDTVVGEHEESEPKEETTTNPETDTGEASTSKPTTEEETRDEEETSEYPSSDPPSYADIASTASTSETLNDTLSTSATTEEPPTDSTLPVEAESTEVLEQNTTNDTKAEHSESKTESQDHEVPAKVSSVEAEDKAAPGPAEVANADAADETEATKTVAD
jgi:hypothetical protein